MKIAPDCFSGQLMYDLLQVIVEAKTRNILRLIQSACSRRVIAVPTTQVAARRYVRFGAAHLCREVNGCSQRSDTEAATLSSCRASRRHLCT